MQPRTKPWWPCFTAYSELSWVQWRCNLFLEYIPNSSKVFRTLVLIQCWYSYFECEIIRILPAALVKILRRCLKEMSAKSTTFVNAGLAFERSSDAKVSIITSINFTAIKFDVATGKAKLATMPIVRSHTVEVNIAVYRTTNFKSLHRSSVRVFKPQKWSSCPGHRLCEFQWRRSC